MTDYSKTQIYKIVCKDPTITSFYIGSTINFTKRKYQHKCRCYREKDKKYNLLIYQTIRKNNGFENWSMILIENYPCENRREAEKREQYYKDLLKPDLNMVNCYTSKDKRKEQKKEYKEINKDKIKEQTKIYKEINKDKIKIYNENNKEIIKETKKEYYENNKDKIKQQTKEYREKIKDIKFACDCCNIEIQLRNKTKHLKSKNHITNSLKEFEKVNS